VIKSSADRSAKKSTGFYQTQRNQSDLGYASHENHCGMGLDIRITQELAITEDNLFPFPFL